MNFLGFGQSADLDIVFDGAENRKMAEIKTDDGKKEKYLLYYDGETVSGKVNVTLKKPGSKLEHQGIKIDLIGQIELYYDRGNHHEFLSLVRELARPGDLIQNTSYPFEFANVEKLYEVYVGSNVRLRYFLRITIVRRLSDIVKEIDIAVHTLCSYPEINSPIKMEVGIEDCLHIEFEYNKSKYHLKDVIVGKIYFLLVRIKIKHMEIAIIKRETTGSGPNTFTENETIAKYEIMDGAPVKGESIPIRVFLAGYDLTPTMRDINKKFSVKYFLNLVLMDTEDRRYFKQQEITLWRKAEKNRKSSSIAQNNPHVPSHLVGSDTNDMIHNKRSSAGMMQASGDGGGGGGSSSGNHHHHNQQQQHQQQQFDDDDEDDGNCLDTSPLPIMDPTIGLFTQESPEKEFKSSLQNNNENNSNSSNYRISAGDTEKNNKKLHELPLPLDSPPSSSPSSSSPNMDDIDDKKQDKINSNSPSGPVANISTIKSPQPLTSAIDNKSANSQLLDTHDKNNSTNVNKSEETRPLSTTNTETSPSQEKSLSPTSSE